MCFLSLVCSHHTDTEETGSQAACFGTAQSVVTSKGLDFPYATKSSFAPEAFGCPSFGRSILYCKKLEFHSQRNNYGEQSMAMWGMQASCETQNGLLSRLWRSLDSNARHVVHWIRYSTQVAQENQITTWNSTRTVGYMVSGRRMGHATMAGTSTQKPSQGTGWSCKRERKGQREDQIQGEGKVSGTGMGTSELSVECGYFPVIQRDPGKWSISPTSLDSSSEAAGPASRSSISPSGHADCRFEDDHKAASQCRVTAWISKEATRNFSSGKDTVACLVDYFCQGVHREMEKAPGRLSRTGCQDGQTDRRSLPETSSLAGKLSTVPAEGRRGGWTRRSYRAGDGRGAPRHEWQCCHQPSRNGDKLGRHRSSHGTRGASRKEEKGRTSTWYWKRSCLMIVGRQVCALSQAACCGLEFSSWTHSVQQQPDFLSPWKAVENAAELARELDSAHSTHPIAELLTEVRKPKSQRRMVTFDSDIQLIFHQDSICAMTMIPHPGLQNWVDKPWHLAIKRCHKEVEESTALYPHVRDLWCDNWQSSPIPSDGTQPTEQFVEQQPIQDPQHEFDHTAPYTFHNSTTPWRSRLLDEHNRVRVGDGSDEHTQVDGLDRTGDPEDEQLVIIDGWQDLLEILHQNTPSPDSLIHLEMYGLHITHHSIRITDCEATIAAIREAVQQSWSDAMPPRSVAYLHLVRPQEHRHARAVVIQMIVEIVPFGVDIPPNDVPILRRIRWHSDHSITLETAYMRDHQTGYELLFDAHLDEWCHPRNGVQCNLHIESHTALMAHRHHLLPGSLLEIFIHDDDRPGVPVSSSASSQHVDPQPRTQQSAIGSLDVLQEWLVECSCSHVSLVMYGLCGSSLGTRYATSQAEHQQVRSAVLQAWQDYVQPDTAVTLHMVRPQDDQRPDHLHLIVELTGPSQVRPAGYLPILQRISWRNIWQGDTSAAVYRVSGLNMRQLLTACSLSEWCGPSTRAICRIQVERQLLPISANIDLLAGSLLEILVSLQPNEDEAASFLQGKQSLHTSVSTSHPHVSDRWCDDLLDTCPLVKSGTPEGSKDQNGPPVLTCRPNAAITLEFDDFIPLPNGGRIIPPPNWRQNSLLRYASNNEAVFRDRSGFLTVDCRTWLLPHGGGGYRQPRDLRIQAQLLIHLTERIRHLWRDVVAPSDALRVQHVRPTPLARGNQQQLPKLHLLVEVNRPLGDISRPILFSFQQISAQGLSDEVDWLPSLTEEVVTLQSILQVSSLECAARNLLVPLADRARGWMGTQQQRHVAPGAYIPIWWDLRWNADPEPAPRGDAISTPVDLHDMDDLSLLQQLHGGQQQGNDQEEDVLTLMQRSASRSPRRNTPMSASSHDEENRVPVHTFRMSSSYRKVVLERSQEMTYIPQLTRLWQVPPHNPLLAVHQVWHGPADLESGAKATLLLELASDRNRQAIADDQMVLVDIALESSGDITTIRRVLWTRRFMTRSSFLHLLSVQEFCNSPATDCHVEKNKVTWHKQDTFSREFRSGDYVRLLVRGPTTMTPAEVQVVLCEQEGADAQRYLYTRSPSHSPEPSAHSAEGAESEFEIFQDSPVESLTLTRQKDEKDPIHGGPISQNTPRRQNLEHLSSQGHPLAQCRPGFKPHVSDRWCASHGLDTEEIGVPVKSLPPIFALDELYSQRREPFANWTNKDLSMRSSPQANPEMAPKLLILDDLIPPSNLLSPSDANPGVTSTSHPLEEKDIACYEDPLSVPISLPGLPDFADKLTSPYLQLSQNIPTSQQVGEDHATLVDDWNKAVDFAIANQHHDPEQIAIYTDGSKLWNEHLIEDTSGWSFVVAAKWPSSLQWGIVGHSSASVNLTADSDSWIGATAHQSYQSELEAIIRALLWLCQSPWIHGGMQCTLISDATSALYAVDGSFTVRHIYFSKVVRPLCKFVDSLAPIALRWEKAHAGQIFNELADHLAGKAARSAPQTFQASIIHPIRDQQLLAWLWFCGNARQIYPELPKVDSSGFHLPIPRPLKCVDFQRPKVDVSIWHWTFRPSPATSTLSKMTPRLSNSPGKDELN